MGKFLDIDELMFADENTLECIWINDFNFENLSIDDEGCDTIMVYYNNKFRNWYFNRRVHSSKF